jgi:choline dehydrogenase-like flavoprotein
MSPPPRLEDDADFVIVGTGAGGATAARVLTEAGHTVVLLEEGPDLRGAGKRPRDLLGAMTLTFRDMGSTVCRGPRPFPFLQGRLVGGTTAINSGITWRLPDDVREDWRTRLGLGALVDDLDPVFDRLDTELGVTETPRPILGGNALAMEAGARALGLAGGRVIQRNIPTCKGRGLCLQGCPGEERRSMDVSFVPAALAGGARLHALARVDRIRIRDGRAEGVEGVVLDPVDRRPTGELSVRARRAVIVAGGAIQTPVLLRASGLKRLVGDGLMAHPGAAVVGRFDRPVGMGFGATQGYEVSVRDRGYKLDCLSVPPEMLASRLPGAGAEWQARLAALDHYAQWGAQVRMGARGRVRRGWRGRAVIHYAPLQEDVARLREAVVLMARMMFAAGAIEVHPGLSGFPAVLASMDEVRRLEEGPVDPRTFQMLAAHYFATAPAASDPARGVVGADLQSHDVKGLYVMDASALPTNIGVNPQHVIMAVVFRAAARLAA